MRGSQPGLAKKKLLPDYDRKWENRCSWLLTIVLQCVYPPPLVLVSALCFSKSTSGCFIMMLLTFHPHRGKYNDLIWIIYIPTIIHFLEEHDKTSVFPHWKVVWLNWKPKRDKKKPHNNIKYLKTVLNQSIIYWQVKTAHDWNTTRLRGNEEG